MTKADMKMPEDFLMKVSKLADKADTIVPKVLEAGGEVVLSKVKSNLRSVIGKNTKSPSKSTGEPEAALGITSVKQDKDGNHNIKIGFAEPRSDGGNNAKIANVIEYGKHGQPAKPFLKPAKSSSKKQCIDVMKAKLDEEIGNI